MKSWTLLALGLCALALMVNARHRNLQWFCVAKITGVKLTTTDLQTAQKSLGIGNGKNIQAIIPMTVYLAQDPHTLDKSWTGGSMYWNNWSDIKKMQSFCEKPFIPEEDGGDGGYGEDYGDGAELRRQLAFDTHFVSTSSSQQTGKLQWFCVAKITGVKLKTTDLQTAQKSLGIGNGKNIQAIIPMTDNSAQDPHTLDKSWTGGSMYWNNWNEIKKMQSFCEKPYIPEKLQWYCAAKITGAMLITTDLKNAQINMGIGDKENIQAIIPMTDKTAGDPHTLDKSWNGGSMWWNDWNDINKMRSACEKAGSSGKLQWFCVAKITGVKLKTTDLQTAQKSLGIGNGKNIQAIIPMTDNSAQDPHTLDKSWTGGSMYWNNWNEIKKMQSFCEKPYIPEKLQWYCAAKITGAMLITTDLKNAQINMGIGDKENIQAIIPMTDKTAGDPHTLDKSWNGGSMWWNDWSDINKMRSFCEKAGSSGKLQWFCVAKISGVKLKTTDLQTAQKSLGIGNGKNIQAIIPMIDKTAGDPHTLDKKWTGGSMWWNDWNDIDKMRNFCSKP